MTLTITLVYLGGSVPLLAEKSLRVGEWKACEAKGSIQARTFKTESLGNMQKH